jgi:hypothetical protein
MECCYISVSVSKYVDNDPLLAYGQRERTHVNLSRERQALKACTEVTLTVELSSWFQSCTVFTKK